jgi:hypothetical protein
MMNHPDDRRQPWPAGLCDACRFAHVIESRRGSRFVRCGRAKDDPEYQKYPRLPVVECAGYDAPDVR